jgi:NAD(P)-dependent dehydrogenase (short-subunit alcohol dehydrogenase family)
MTSTDPALPASSPAPALRLQGRVALITGASRGIGAAVARRLAAEGAQVVLVARTVGGLEAVDDAIREAGGLPATLIPQDLMELDRIDAIGPAIHDRHGRLDIVVGNAGTLGALSPIAASDPKAWAMVMTLNVLANARLIGSVDRLLRQSDAGRAIFVTDTAATGAVTPFWGLYGASKTALETLVRTYAAEVVRPELRVNLVDPGPVRTALRSKAFPGEDVGGLRLPEAVTGLFAALAGPDCRYHGALLRHGDI